MPIGIYKHHPQQGFQKGHPTFKGCEKGQFKKGHKMRVGLKNSSEAKINMGLAQKKRFENPKEREKTSKTTKEGMKNPITRKKLSLARKGKPRPGNPKNWIHSEITKKKISKNRKGKLLGDKNPAKRIDVRKKLSEANKGEKSNLWKDGRSPENIRIRRGIEYRLWRESVFARDNWTCQRCKIRGGRLDPHHIKNFAQFLELRFAIDNGITLCRECHNKFHKKYGKKNNNEEQLKEFLII